MGDTYFSKGFFVTGRKARTSVDKTKFAFETIQRDITTTLSRSNTKMHFNYINDLELVPLPDLNTEITFSRRALLRELCAFSTIGSR